LPGIDWKFRIFLERINDSIPAAIASWFMVVVVAGGVRGAQTGWFASLVFKV
jgi:hypothetical protein